MDQKTSILFEHYRDSNAMTGGIRRERNRFFVYLLTAIAIGVLLTFNPAESAEFLVAAFAGLLGVQPDAVVDFLPYHVIDGLLLAVVFFFMANLYQRSVLLLAYYRYIGDLESELRGRLQLPPDSIAFTREGAFYWENKPYLQGLTKYFYALIIAFSLGVYLVKKATSDWMVFQGLPDGEAQDFWALAPLIADALIGIPLLIIFLGYVIQTIARDQKPNRGEEIYAKAAQELG